MMTPHLSETVQMALILGYLLKAWNTETPLLKTAFLWWFAVLAVDVYVFHCVRPVWMQWGVNSVDMLLGWIVIYEKYRQPCRRMLQAIMAVLVNLCR